MDDYSGKATKPLSLKFITPVQMPPWALGSASTPAGRVFRVSTEWSRDDVWGSIRARISAFRMTYAVPPGLYAVGEPGDDSPVLVSANYKLSFDVLRRSLKGMNVWILVLDTNGINVWCAAGKGTFGTGELIGRIRSVRLNAVVQHGKIVVPQLGAPGINAREVQKETGFRVYYGPVRAEDIPAYVNAGFKATGDMRIVQFPMIDRLVLTPMEINPAMKRFPLFAGIVLLIMGLQPEGILFRDAWVGGLPLLVLGFVSILAGAFITPVLLPFIPFRAFGIKGWIVGMMTVALVMRVTGYDAELNGALLAFSYLFFPLASSYIALQFTGSTTFTSMAGVRKELRVGVPVYIAGSIGSLIIAGAYKLYQWGVI